MRRRSFQLLGANGSIQVEVERGQNAALEVREVDLHGNPVNGSIIVHNWDTALEKASDILAAAVKEGRV